MEKNLKYIYIIDHFAVRLKLTLYCNQLYFNKYT